LRITHGQWYSVFFTKCGLPREEGQRDPLRSRGATSFAFLSGGLDSTVEYPKMLMKPLKSHS